MISSSQKKVLFLLFPYVVAVCISVCLVSFSSYTNAKNMLTLSVGRNFQYMLADAKRSVDARMDRIAELGQLMARSQALMRLLDPRSTEEEAGTAMMVVRDTLERLAGSTMPRAALAVFDATGMLRTDTLSGAGLDITDAKYFSPIMRGREVRSMKRHMTNGKLIMYTAVPVMYRGQVLGGCLVGMPIEDLSTAFSNRADKSVDTHFQLVDENHTIIAATSPHMSLGTSFPSTAERAAILESSNVLLPADAKGSRLSMRTGMGDLDLSLVACADTKLLMAPAATLLKRTLINGTLAGLASIIIVYFLLRLVLRRQATSEAKLSQVVTLASLPTWEWSAGGMLKLNEFALRLLGLPAEPGASNIFPMKWYLERVHPEDLANIATRVDAPMNAEPVSFDATFRMRHEDGHWHHVRTVGHIIQWNAQGLPQQAGGVYIDIHEAHMRAVEEKEYQQQLEAAVQEHVRVNTETLYALSLEKALLRNVIDNIPDLICYKGMNLTLMGCNKAFASHFPPEWEGSPATFPSSVPMEIRVQDNERDEELLRTGISQVAEQKVRSPGTGQVLELEVRNNLMSDASGTPIGVVSVGRDIKKRKKAEVALLQAQAEATASSKAKGEFLANMSHEIRTPLNGILGLNHLARMHADSKDVQQYLDKTAEAARSMLNIVNDILDFSQIEDGCIVLENAPFSLHDCLETLIENLRPVAEGNKVLLEYTLDPRLPQCVLGDVQRFTQILHTLLSNALKFTHAGFVLALLTPEEQSSGEQKSRMVIKVQDSGIGMDETLQEKLFQPLTASPSDSEDNSEGKNLGLVITRALILAMGGSLTVESSPGSGSCFTLYLPLIPAEDKDQENKPTHQPLLGRKILLVEDNDINQMIAMEMLEVMGCEVALAVNGQQAVEMGTHESFDLVLMDIQMPVMDGLTAARCLRDAGCTMPIIALSANAMQQDRKNTHDAGMQDHLAKPIDFAGLESTLRQWLS